MLDFGAKETRVDQSPAMMMGPPLRCGRFGCGPGYCCGFQVSVREIAYAKGRLTVNAYDRASGKGITHAVYTERLTGKGGRQAAFGRAATVASKSQFAAK